LKKKQDEERGLLSFFTFFNSIKIIYHPLLFLLSPFLQELFSSPHINILFDLNYQRQEMMNYFLTLKSTFYSGEIISFYFRRT